MTSKNKSDLQFLCLIAVFIAILHFAFNSLNYHFPSPRAYSVLHFLQNGIYTLLFILAVLAVTYNRLWTSASLKSIFAKTTLVVLVLLTSISTYGLLGIYDKANSMYAYFKRPWVGIEGTFFKADPLLGYRPIPNSKGFQTFSVSKTVEGKCPVFFDEQGFRVPQQKPAFLKNDTTNLFLGCSFTFSDFNLAEETYPYLVSEKLQNNYENAGLSGYGLSQMLLRSRELMSRKKYKYVFFQYSGWLITRSIIKYGELIYGYRPFPYVVKSDTGNYIHPPLFKSSVYDVPREPFKESPVSIKDKLAFFYKIAYPVLFKDQLKKLYCDAAIWLHLIPDANSDRLDLVKYFYSEFYKLCKENGAQMVVVRLLNNTAEDEIMIKEIAKLPGIIIVDTDSALNERITNGDRFEITNRNSYTTAYGHTVWNGIDTVVYDTHYNYHASKIIADEIVKKLAEADTIN